MPRVLKILLASIGGIIAIPFFAFAYTSPGNPTGYINDFAGVLSSDTKASLEQELTQFDKDTTSQISVATIHSLNDDDIESYANTLYREWGIGTKEKNNGVLFLIAVDDHKMRIEVGYGLEGALPDTTAKNIIEDVVTPSFKRGDYDKGITDGVKAIEQATKGEYTASSSSSGSSNDPMGIFFTLAIFVFILMPFLGSVLGRSKSWWLGGVFGGVGGGIFALISSAFWSVPFFIIGGLLFDYLVSRNYKEGKHSWWAGGQPGYWDDWGSGGSSSSGGGSSFGGFGGGSSGGGGASGGW